MTVDGREDLYNYTYLNANGYLNKFRGAMGMPDLPLSRLAALLKEFGNRTTLKGFITTNRQGKPCLYCKRTLNAILGMSSDGHMHTSPEHNPYIKALMAIEEEWERKEYERESMSRREYEPIDYSSDEEDMQKMSDALANLEESGGRRNIYITEEQLSQIHNHKMKSSKNIIISEEQENELKKRLSENYFVETDKVKMIRDFLDDHFERGANPYMGGDGYPVMKPIMGLKIGDPDNSTKPMTPSQVFYMLQDRFKGICSDRKERDAFLKQVLIDWYNKSISYDGMLSRNNI